MEIHPGVMRETTPSTAGLSLAPPLLGETLLLIDIVNAEGVIIMQTIWATTPDRPRGHRLTRIESVPDHASLMRRLTELSPMICWQFPASVSLAPAAE
jgi:hypothetical protein